MADGTPRAIQASSASFEAFDPLLAVWLSPAFPVGAFAYSHGLEWAAHKGWIRDRESLGAWIADLIAHGALRSDLIILAAAARATAAGDFTALAEVNQLALALQPSAERRLESAQPGTSFAAAIRAAWPAPGLDAACRHLADEIAYPVAVGLSIAVHGIDTGSALQAFGLAAVGNYVSAAIRLSAIGQTDGQRVIAELLPLLRTAAAATHHLTLDDIGGAALRSDVASLAHETQYTRLFRS